MVVSILFAGAIFSKQGSFVLENSQQIQISSNNRPREVLARESRPLSEVEIYYGKPGIYNLEEMLKAYKVITYPEDIVQVFPDPSFGVGAQIKIKRATPIILFDADNKTVFRTFKGTIKDFLEEKNIVLGTQDQIEPEISTPITKNLEVSITRVEETQITEKIYLDFKTIKKEDPNLAWGKTKVIQKGIKGVKEAVYQVKRVNGVEVSRVLLEEHLIKQPTDQIVVYGTKKVGWATWYGPGFQGKGTACGDVFNMYDFTAAHLSLPCGTMVKVTNLTNGRSVTVRINDRGPYSGGYIIDLSYAAKEAIGMISRAHVSLEY